MPAAVMRMRLPISLRKSMTAQFSLSIGLITFVVIAVCGISLDKMFQMELRRDNELALLANLVFIRDELAIDGRNLDARVRRLLVDRPELRYDQLSVAFLDTSR